MILGIDYDSRAVHLCLLDDDTNAARYVPLLIETDPRAGKNDAFGAARNVREAMRHTDNMVNFDFGWYRDSAWENVWLVGIEDAFHNSHRTKVAQARIQGAILASIPRDVCVVPLPAYEWKIAVLGEGGGNAKKPEVKRWARTEMWRAEGRDVDQLPTCDRQNWPQDAYDAYCIARAVRDLNDAGIANAVAARSEA